MKRIRKLAALLVALGLALALTRAPGASAQAKPAADPPAAPLPAKPAEADWRDPGLMRTYLRKAGSADRLAAYRDWLTRTSLEEPRVSSDIGSALAADFPALGAAEAKGLSDLIAVALSRKGGFWPSFGEAREGLVGAILDRPEAELASLALSLAPLAPSGFSLTKSRSAALLALIGEGKRQLTDPEAKALWRLSWAAIGEAADPAPARALAARVMELSRYSAWSWSYRLPLISLDRAAAAFADPKLPPAEARLFLALAAATMIDERGMLTFGPRFEGAEASKRIFAAKLKSGEPAYGELAALFAKSPGRAAKADPVPAPDPARLAALGDLEAGLSLLRYSREAGEGGSSPAEAALVRLLDPARPAQAAAAASLLSGNRGAAAVAALSALVKDGSVRDPVLLIIAMRALAASLGSDCIDLVVLLCANPAAEVREAACRSLVRFGDPRAVPALLSRLSDPEKDLRLAAIEGLGALRDSRAVDPLGAMLLSAGEDKDVKEACARALGKIGDTRTVQVFLRFLLMPRGGSEAEGAARVYAAMSLGQKREKAAVDALLRNIDPSREEDLNYHCIVALGRIADPAGLRALLPIARKGLPVWQASPWTRTPPAVYWALLPLEEGLARPFYLERWKAAATAKPGASDKPDPSLWYSALYLSKEGAKDEPEGDRGARSAYLVKELASAISSDPAMAGEALDRFPVPALLGRAASLLAGLDSYSKSWIASALINNPEAAMIPAFRSLLDCEDDYLAYAALASMDHLISRLPSPLSPELKAQLGDFYAKLPALSALQLAGGTRNWRDVVQKRLGNLLDASR
jgi:HEAT repeat protein